MELHKAREIYNQLLNSRHEALVKSMLKHAVRYSRIRVDWFLSDHEGRIELEVERTIAHNAFIDTCEILSRNMHQSGENNNWYIQIGVDRKTIGDFACVLHAVLGINAR